MLFILITLQNNMTALQNVEWLITQIQTTSTQFMHLDTQIKMKTMELDNLPEVIRLKEEIRTLEVEKRKAQEKELELRDTGKQILIDSGMKEFTTLDGTTIAVQFTPWALVVEEWATIPDEFYKVKTTKDLDKTALKKAISDGTFSDDKVYIQKDSKLVIKSK